jgi:metabolite-proton symporter
MNPHSEALDMERPASASISAKRTKRQYASAGIASMVGTTIEWYDFFLYGTAAALIFNKIFFTAIDPITGTLAAFGTYAVGFFARPLGAVVFGHYGDRIGRRSMLLITLLLMGIPTVLIGLLPSYESIGYWAAALLVLMRILQGVAVGGEWGGAVLMAVEHAPEGKKGLFGSLPQAGVGAGLILSSLAMGAVSRLPEADFMSWGWRVPFLASVLMLAVGGFIRVKVSESPEFEKMKKRGKQVGQPVLEVIKRHPRSILAVMGARFAEVSWFYTVVTFALAYAANTLGVPKAEILSAISAGAFVSIFTMPCFGLLGDRIGQKRVFFIGMVALCLFAFPFFSLLADKGAGSLWLAMICAIGGVYAMMYAVEAPLFSSQFPAEVRYSGISLSVQLSGAIGGGLAPIVATSLLAMTGGDPRYVCLYLIALGMLAMVCVSLMKAGEHAE